MMEKLTNQWTVDYGIT